MSIEVLQLKSRFQEHIRWLRLSRFTGDFSAMEEYLSHKNGSFWNFCTVMDTLLRGFAQVALANNPITGLLIVVALSAIRPDVLAICAISGFLGLAMSWVIREPMDCIKNGLTMFNPMLVGAVSYKILPLIYGPFDGFSILLTTFGSIYSVYFARGMRSMRLPALALPFLISEFTILIILKNHSILVEPVTSNETTMDDAVRNGTVGNRAYIDTVVNVDWGMVFRGSVTSASQLFAVDDVALGSIIYLAVFIYSPIIAGSSFLGSLIGTLIGAGLGAPYDIVYTGIWGLSCYLSGAGVGGTFLVMNGQTAVAAFAATVFASVLQYALFIVFNKTGIPPLTLAFHIATWLFVALGTTPEGIFYFPGSNPVSIKTKKDIDLGKRRQTSLDKPVNADEPEVLIKVESKIAST